MTKMLTALVFAATAGLSSYTPMALARPLTCAQLAGGLQGNGDPMTDYGAILLGVVQTARPKVCVPSGTNLSTLKAVFIHWVDGHEGAADTEGWSCAARAFRESYPCS